MRPETETPRETRATDQPMQCRRCGQPHAPGCTSHRRDGGPCRNFPMHGQRVCRMHGGSSPRAKAAAARRVAEAQAEALLEVIWNPDASPVEDNVSAMKRLAGQLTHAVDVLGGRLGGDDLDGATSIAWGKVLRELRQLLVAMERLGIEQRYVELQQAQAAIVVAAVRHALDALGPELLPTQRDVFLRAFLTALGRGPEGAPALVVRGDVGTGER